MPIDLDKLKITSNRRKNLRALETRLARNVELWIANTIDDETFFRKLENIELILKANAFLKHGELYKYYDDKGEVRPQYHNKSMIVSLQDIGLKLPNLSSNVGSEPK